MLRETYGSLRWLLVLLPAVLFVVSVLTALTSRELETSISAYYGGPVRDVFVGVLVAVAACLVAYQGSTTFEDYNLNGAGSYAAFVALVPAGLDEILADLRRSALLTPQGVTPAEYVWSLRFGLTSVVALSAMLLARELRRSHRVRALAREDRTTGLFILLTSGTLVAFLTLAMWQLWVPPVDEVRLEGLALGLPGADLRLSIHHLAAIFLISALAVAVWSHAWPHRATRTGSEAGPGYDELVRRRGYQLIFFLMLAGPLVAAAAAQAFAPGHLVIFLEWWEIGLFCVFWVLETRRLSAPPPTAQPAMPVR
ncbi:hypothetical protein GCM10011366_09690 [Ornithinimicrobium tianjinense]|uniref:Uncharacterized protein n=1 Tax=Ornithinimicrobium tianjinense TaxID=1195761 RepID=A0A917BGK1_9MICO|nr:hypothetical protein GCM10011366_09690 [Ornithinimicrobium tianjinense]